jgi:hypothetical protein
MVDFIGIGAQKSGTSWVYACLYEHPQICAPIKEIHFFSRPRFEKGVEWYEQHFTRCERDKKKGEFSTSYLYSEEAPSRIADLYPGVKLIAIVRNPVHRAVSQYKNAIKAGEINSETSFETYTNEVQSVIAQGLYFAQLQRYFAHFSKEQILVLVYEDSKKDPITFIRSIYDFIGVDSSFVPSMLHAEINIARTPTFIGIERLMHRTAEFLRSWGFGRIVHTIRVWGIPDLLRRFNTRASSQSKTKILSVDTSIFKDDVTELSRLLKRDLVKEWNII